MLFVVCSLLLHFPAVSTARANRDLSVAIVPVSCATVVVWLSVAFIFRVNHVFDLKSEPLHITCEVIFASDVIYLIVLPPFLCSV